MMKDSKRDGGEGNEERVRKSQAGIAVLRLINCADACHRARPQMVTRRSVKLKIRHATFTHQLCCNSAEGWVG